MKYKSIIYDRYIVLYATDYDKVAYKLEYIFFGGYKSMQSDIRYIFAAKASWDPLLRMHIYNKYV
jgi:hypothetical protein